MGLNVPFFFLTVIFLSSVNQRRSSCIPGSSKSPSFDVSQVVTRDFQLRQEYLNILMNFFL